MVEKIKAESVDTDIEEPGLTVVEDENSLLFVYNRYNVRVVRLWREVSDSEVRCTNKEEYTSFKTGERETAYRHTWAYEIDEQGRLIGDGSNWSGEGRFWEDYAKDRNTVLLNKRFPRLDI